MFHFIAAELRSTPFTYFSKIALVYTLADLVSKTAVANKDKRGRDHDESDYCDKVGAPVVILLLDFLDVFGGASI